MSVFTESMPSRLPHQIWLPQLRSTERLVSPFLLAVTIQSSRQCRLNRTALTSISSQTMKPVEHWPLGTGDFHVDDVTISTDDLLPPVSTWHRADASWGERYFAIHDPGGHDLSFARPLTNNAATWPAGRAPPHSASCENRRENWSNNVGTAGWPACRRKGDYLSEDHQVYAPDLGGINRHNPTDALTDLHQSHR